MIIAPRKKLIVEGPGGRAPSSDSDGTGSLVSPEHFGAEFEVHAEYLVKEPSFCLGKWSIVQLVEYLYHLLTGQRFGGVILG